MTTGITALATGGIFDKIKLAVMGVLALAIVTAVGAGALYIRGVINDNATLRVNAAKYDNAIEQQKQTIGALQGANAEWKGALKDLQGKMQEMVGVQRDAVAETKRLNDVFAKHDLGKLSVAKPGLVEKSLTAGTARVGSMLECATGARNQDCPSSGGAPAGKTGPPRP
jgi:hypothetical protein